MNETRTSYIEGAVDSYGKDFVTAVQTFLAVTAIGLGTIGIAAFVMMFIM